MAILAGGLAMRLRPLTAEVPKSIIPVNGEPFIVHQLRLLCSQGVEKVVVCVGYLGEMIQEVVQDGSRFGVQVQYSRDGAQLLGTAGAVRNALPLLGSSFFVMYGDSYLPCDYARAEKQFLNSGKLGLMTVFRNCGQWDVSNVEFSDGEIVAYSKTKKSSGMQYIDYGLGLFHANAFSSGVPDLAEVYRELLAKKQLAALEVAQRFYEIGSWDGLKETSEFLSKEGALQE